MANILMAALLFAAVPVQQPPEPDRQMCEEVAHEINLWYIEGNISREEADRIITRCFFLFG